MIFKNYFIKGLKKDFCTGCPKSAVRGCKQKVGKSQEFSGMGCRKIF